MTSLFVYANPGERRNQSLPDWDQAPLALAQFERIIPPVFNMPTPHRQQAESVPGRTPGLPVVTTPALASFGSFPSQGPAAFSMENAPPRTSR